MHKNDQTRPQPANPCIRQCCLDQSDICLGCFRSLAEITGWYEADSQTRCVFLDNAQRRRLRHKARFPLSSFSP